MSEDFPPIRVARLTRENAIIEDFPQMSDEVLQEKPKRQRKSRKKVIRSPSPPPPLETIPEEEEAEFEQEQVAEEINCPDAEEDPDFLKDLESSDPIEEKEQTPAATISPSPEFMEKMSRKKPKRPTAPKGQKVHPFFPDEQFQDCFSDSPTEILGGERRRLLTKLQQYKNLFPEELKTFKIKKNPSVQDLEDAISECDNIISCGTVEGFLTEAILSAIQTVETISANTRNFDISGTSAVLRQNARFMKLCRQCMIKYNTFANVPPETQLFIIVATTALMCQQSNRKKNELRNYLNEPLE